MNYQNLTTDLLAFCKHNWIELNMFALLKGPVVPRPGVVYFRGPLRIDEATLWVEVPTQGWPALDESVVEAAAVPGSGTLVFVWEFSPGRVVWAPLQGPMSPAVVAAAEFYR